MCDLLLTSGFDAEAAPAGLGPLCTPQSCVHWFPVSHRIVNLLAGLSDRCSECNHYKWVRGDQHMGFVRLSSAGVQFCSFIPNHAPLWPQKESPCSSWPLPPLPGTAGCRIIMVLGTFMSRLDGALSNLTWLKMFLLTAEELD